MVTRPGEPGPEKLVGWRSLFVTVFGIDHEGHRYEVEVDFLEWEAKVALFVDGVCREVRVAPARLALAPNLRIEVRVGKFGLKEASLIHGDDPVPLQPATGSGEAWRRDLERDHPTASRIVGITTWTVLGVAALLELPQLAQVLSATAGFDIVVPIQLPAGVDAALWAAALVAGMERALRMKCSEFL